MIQINGWIVINNGTDGEADFDALTKIVNLIEEIIKPLNFDNQMLQILNFNGDHTLFIGLNHNHDIGYFDSILTLLSEIGILAIGSYGLVYVRNPEDIVDYNRFKVLKLAKGKVTLEVDSLLSPCNPIIED